MSTNELKSIAETYFDLMRVESRLSSDLSEGKVKDEYLKTSVTVAHRDVSKAIESLVYLVFSSLREGKVSQ